MELYDSVQHVWMIYERLAERARKLGAVADAARALYENYDAIEIDYVCDLGVALRALDAGRTAKEQEWPDDEGRAWRRRCARLGVPYEEE